MTENDLTIAIVFLLDSISFLKLLVAMMI